MKYIFLVLLFSGQKVISAKGEPIDSLLSVLKNAKEDTLKVESLINISSLLAKKQPQEALSYAQEGYALAKKLNYIKGQGICLSNISSALYYQGEYTKALAVGQQALSIKEKTGEKLDIVISLNGIGLIYDYIGNNNMALQYYRKALAIAEEINDKKYLSSIQNNIGLIYSYRGQTDSALYFYDRALVVQQKLNNKIGIASLYNNYASLYYNKNDLKKCIEFDRKALALREELGDKFEIGCSLNNLGYDFIAIKDYKTALDLHLKALGIGTEIKAKEVMKAAYDGLAHVYYDQKNYKLAYDYTNLFTLIKDSIFNEQTATKLSEMEVRYQTAQKDKELVIKSAQLEKQEAHAKEQYIIRNAFIIGFALVLLLAIFIFRSYKQKQKANEIITQQKQTVEAQKALVEEHQKEILDSIHYARRIQSALITPEKYIEKTLDKLNKD